MIRPATDADRPALEVFLARHANSSMFLRSNLEEVGIGNADHPHGTLYLLQMAGERVRGVFGLTNEGFGLCQAPEADAGVWADFADAVRGRMVKGITGPDEQVGHAIAALGLSKAAFTVDAVEPLYRLDLADLILPDGPCDIRAPQTLDVETLTFWYLGYGRDTGSMAGPDATTRAIERAVNAIQGDVTRVLIVGGRPVAMTAFNAQFQDMVQIGGVYTPDGQRGQGYARRVVAAHLAEARAKGTKTALLFSNNDAASRAYEAIGFQRVGSYRVAVLHVTVEIGA
ncbi:GNAT family N-acetyltransferase [Thalassobius sp. Cn5-15]|uniref:GNAT family N-acetyltransferase n=1 Tax=Thalassobius sp. Cn5-15 TaxID=2917763 RepID=UPI001EF31165|nr:GNAT family N-acetyltransferase [Thalassobius sp. Cn5-15]MCG7493433.1 GNAT family N-acetyltransferase [Thalassobius sp. Cn5-15]